MERPARGGTSAFYRPRRQRGLDDLLAAAAGHARPHDAVHDKTTRDIFQFLGNIVPKFFEFAAAMSTGVARRQDFLVAW